MSLDSSRVRADCANPVSDAAIFRGRAPWLPSSGGTLPHPTPSWLPSLSGPQAYEGVLQLVEARGRYEELCIVMCVIPATISNNVPGTDFSLGSDTAVNAAMEVRCPGEGLQPRCGWLRGSPRPCRWDDRSVPPGGQAPPTVSPWICAHPVEVAQALSSPAVTGIVGALGSGYNCCGLVILCNSVPMVHGW